MKQSNSPDLPRWDDFGRAVPSGGYSWWYIDAISNDKKYAVTVIAFIGSVFSPYYRLALARQREPDPLDHSSFNVAVYGIGRGGWAMTERNRNAVAASPGELSIGPSSLTTTATGLRIEFDERSMPFARRLNGHIDIEFKSRAVAPIALDSIQRHWWRPISPVCDINVNLKHPDLTWQGRGYVDCNYGERPLESDFERWNWARLHHGSSCSIQYATTDHGGKKKNLNLLVTESGSVLQREPLPRITLPKTRWRVGRAMFAENQQAVVVKTLEDTPFYSRSIVRAQVDGEQAAGVHESLDLKRFSQTMTQLMLPFRMPRKTSA